jgi:sulfatase maturation enzyme AslB (radical SAM superfamily)
MLTRIVKFCATKGLLLSVRVSLDGIGDVHDQVRHVTRGFDKANETIAAMQQLSQAHANFQFGLASTIFATNLDDANNTLAWASSKKVEKVFNMLRYSPGMLHNNRS